MAKRVIVTGATGFIGKPTIPLLLHRGYDVHAFTINYDDKDLGEKVNYHQVDIFDYEKVGRVCKELEADSLLHMAWFNAATDRMTSPVNLAWVEASLNLVRAFSDSGGNRIVLAGSCAEYDWQYGYCSENRTPTIPDTLYGECKSSLHRLIYRFCRQKGMQYSNGRIFFVYGPREAENRLVAYITKSLLTGQVAEIKHADQIRDYMNVVDVADALVTLLDSEVEGAVNIGSGKPNSLGHIADLIGQKLNKPELIIHKSELEANEKSPLVLADITRLRDELVWEPKYDLESGLEATIDWWKGQNQIMLNEIKS